LDKPLKEFKAFRYACMEESGSLYTPLHEQAKKESTDWNDHWDVMPSKDYGNLRMFFGGFATMFPNTATVESDFSIMRYEKNDYRHSLSNISIAGIMHAKQRHEITSMPLAPLQC
jgi:hypothetical protein